MTIMDNDDRSLMKAMFLLAMAIVVTMSGVVVRAEEWGPWTAGEAFPALQSPAEEDRPVGRAAVSSVDGTGSLPLIALVRVYQAYVSPVYGTRCPMSPSCSQYGIDAIRKHGPVIGIVMTSGRLMHEADERKIAPIRRSGERYLFLDPVENNDFWFGAR